MSLKWHCRYIVISIIYFIFIHKGTTRLSAVLMLISFTLKLQCFTCFIYIDEGMARPSAVLMLISPTLKSIFVILVVVSYTCFLFIDEGIERPSFDSIKTFSLCTHFLYLSSLYRRRNGKTVCCFDVDVINLNSSATSCSFHRKFFLDQPNQHTMWLESRPLIWCCCLTA